jgi:hypothetical protein
MYTIVSNYTEIEQCATLDQAKAVARMENSKYDDAVTIHEGGLPKYLAIHSRLYRLVPTK